MADYVEEPERTEKKRKLSVPLLLLLLLLLLVLWFLFGRDTATEESQRTTVPMEATEQSRTDLPKENPVNSMEELLNPAEGKSLVGKTVDIKQAPVYTVIGDRSFTVGTSDDYAYALLAAPLDAGGAEERVEVTAGQPRLLSGTVKAVPADTQRLAEAFQLNQTQVQELKDRGYYVEVQATNSN